MSKASVLYDSLLNAYRDASKLGRLTEYTSRDSRVSLRLLDWLVTNYAKKHNIVYTIVRENGVTVNFNMFMDYKAQLKAYSKKYFDPFCRRDRVILLNSHGAEQQTTVAQLNFFRWALHHNVIEYALQHKDEIELDMLSITKQRQMAEEELEAAQEEQQQQQQQQPKKRRELSSAAIKSCTKTLCHITVRF